jgi:uncharacterized RDD family membrane protein YckC
MQWFYVKDGERVGPVSDLDFKATFERGDITEDSLVWNKTLTEWIAYKDLPESAEIPAAKENGEYITQTCSLCHKSFSSEDLITFEGKRICAACKPFMVQHLRENAELHTSLDLEYVGFWPRFAAIFIDGIVMSIISVPASLAQTHFAAQGQFESTYKVFAVLCYLIQLVVPAVYEILMIKKTGATLGKMALGIKVVRPDGSSLSWGASIGRYFAKIVSGLILNIGYIMAAFDDEKRALHDRMCNTRVVKK